MDILYWRAVGGVFDRWRTALRRGMRFGLLLFMRLCCRFLVVVADLVLFGALRGVGSGHMMPDS